MSDVKSAALAVHDAWAAERTNLALEQLADRLTPPEELADDDTLPLITTLEEIRRGAKLSRIDAWSNAKNYESLRLESRSSLLAIGPRVRGHAASVFEAVDAAMPDSINGAKLRKGAIALLDRRAIQKACEAAKDVLQSDTGVDLAFLDLGRV